MKNCRKERVQQSYSPSTMLHIPLQMLWNLYDKKRAELETLMFCPFQSQFNYIIGLPKKLIESKKRR
jgi:hypothetical protein